MSYNDNVKKFRRFCARYGMFFANWLVNIMPYSALMGITNFFLAIGWVFTKHLRVVSRESLDIAFGDEKTDAEKEQIVTDCFRSMGRGMVEMLYFIDHPDLITEKVVFEGKEHLDKVLKEGNGAVIVTAHFGNFPLMMIRFALEKYVASVVMRTTRDKAINSFLEKRRNRMGLKTIYTIPRRTCVQQSLRALRNNEIIIMLMDQHFGSDGGVFVDFFGRQAATAIGPLVFAERTKSPIVPVFMVREKGDQHRIIIEPAIEFEENDDYDARIHANTAKITKIIEKYVRLYPHEWGWMHRRWKNQEKKKVAKGKASKPK